MAVNTANSILMSREIFNDHAAARQPRPGSRHGLSRELLTMLVSGPAGATDPVLWTLLLRDRPAQPRAVKAGCQSCGRAGVTGFRAFFRAHLRVGFARGRERLNFSTTRAISSTGSHCEPHRSDKRRVGEEGGSTCRNRGGP